MKLTVGMISKNEEKAVAGVIENIRDALRGYSKGWEILIVDSSEDRTPEIATSRGARVIRQYPPRGYGFAMERLLKSARGDIIVTMDCDSTYPARDILKAVKLIDLGYDIVGTSRLAKRSGNMPLLNYVANRFFSIMASVLFLKRVDDLHTGMRAYRRSMLDSIEYDASYEALPVDLVLIPIRKGYRYTEFDIEYEQRVGETTLPKFRSVVATFRRILVRRFR